MSSGGRGSRGSKGLRTSGNERNSTATQQQQQQQQTAPLQPQKTDSQTSEKEKSGESVPHKIAPTAEQLRIAQMIDNARTEPEKMLQEKINQVMQFTSVTADDAMVALHDCDNDVNAAIDSLLEGDDQGKWQESTKKKKKTIATKNVETESNKENRRVNSRERSGSRPRGGGPPRFRGRGGGSGRGGRENENFEGPSRGEGSRRGRMTNGTTATRGRGGRGRGSSMGPRTFQNRQAPGFTDAIDTWGPLTDDKPNHQNNLKIDTWDDDPPTNNDDVDWDGEWTGSLEQTTVFGPSSSTTSATLTASLSETLVETITIGNSSVGCPDPMAPVPPYASTPPQAYPSPTPSTYSSAPTPVFSSTPASTFPSTTASTASITQPQTMDLAALLQKAAPQSTLSGLVSSSPLGSSSASNGSGGGSRGGGTTLVSPAPGLSVGSQHSILSGLSPNVGESLKAGNLVGSVGVAATAPSPPSSASAPYSTQTVQLPPTIFSSSGLHGVVASSGSLASSISNSNSVLSKSVSLSTVTSSLPSRPKTQRPRIPQTSKIPLSAVEMPEDAMAALDVQFSGLEFGTETFDFTADVKTSSASSSLVSTTPVPVNTRDPASSTPPAAKDLTSASLPSPLPPSQKLGPEPIPFPTSQTSERKPSGGAFVSGGQRSSAGSSATPQGLPDLAKSETGSGTSGLGSLVGSGGPTYQSYTSSKPSSSFPSPPSAPYSQTPSQSSFGSSSQQGGSSGSSSSASGFSNSSSGTGGGTTTTTNQAPAGYGPSFSAQATGAGSTSSQYQNSYVNASSHSPLVSISTPKPLAGLSSAPTVKDTTQNFGEQTSTGGSAYSSTLSTSATVSSNSTSNNSTGPTVLPVSLNSATTHPVQPTKPVPGKVISGLGGSVPPGVHQHQPPHLHQHQQAQQHQPQQPQQHQHQQQQQQQAQQMMAQHSQYVSPPAAALQGALPPAFYTGLQQPMYSLEDFQLLQQRMPHMQQAPTSLATGRDGSMTSAAYSVADAKFRTDQNSSPVPSTMNQQGAQAGGTYITATGNAAMPPFYMYHNMAAVPSTFPQYGAPTAIIQIPPVTNTHTGTNTNQFPAAPKLQYGTGNYYDNLSQTQDFKTGYGSGTQNQNKGGGGTTGSATNSGTDLGGYKNHLSKMGRSYDKQGFHTGTPPPFNLAGSGTNPMTANAYTPMFIPTMPAAQHHSPLMHHQLHQDGGSSGGQRAGSSGGQNKGGSKPSYSGSYWGTN